MLGNRSGRGLTLRYFTAATLTALPEAGQGLAVKNKAEVHLPDYSKLGAADAPYLLVVQEQLDGEGRWVVRYGTPPPGPTSLYARHPLGEGEPDDFWV